MTGHGLKDPDWALKGVDGSRVAIERVIGEAASIARVLGLE